MSVLLASAPAWAKADPEHLSAVWLLGQLNGGADSRVLAAIDWQAAAPIDWRRLLDDHTFSSTERTLVEVAFALFANKSQIDDVPLRGVAAICALNDRQFGAVITALRIRRGDIRPQETDMPTDPQGPSTTGMVPA